MSSQTQTSPTPSLCWWEFQSLAQPVLWYLAGLWTVDFTSRRYWRTTLSHSFKWIILTTTDSCRVMIQSTHWSQLKPSWGRKGYWWPNPAESPDLNPIENLCYKLKNYICKTVKPSSKNELVNGIQEFWNTVSPQCHLQGPPSWRCSLWILKSSVCILEWSVKGDGRVCPHYNKHFTMFSEFVDVFIVFERR